MPTQELLTPPVSESTLVGSKSKIWIDLDNSPHVPFFLPIIEELKAQGYELLVTARDAYQVRDLLEFYGVKALVVGKHYGKSKLMKLVGTGWRAMKLANTVRRYRPDISVSHGSRGCMLASYLLRVENVTIADYEFASKIGTGIGSQWMIYPEVVSSEGMTRRGLKVLKYPGIKEDVYLSRFRPDPELKTRLGIAPNDLVVTIRPPATEAHYHNPESEVLLREALMGLSHIADVKIILLPRNKNQEKELRTAWTDLVQAGRIVIPRHVEDGLNIIWNSDLVISGGGTMNREAAAMGVPVYSIFRGHIGAVDRFLADQGRMILLESVEDVKTKIKIVRRARLNLPSDHANSPALDAIVKHIVSIAEPKQNQPREKRQR